MRAGCCGSEVLMVFPNGLCNKCNNDPEKVERAEAKRKESEDTESRSVKQYQKDKEYYKTKAAKWRDENPEKYLEIQLKSGARSANARAKKYMARAKELTMELKEYQGVNRKLEKALVKVSMLQNRVQYLVRRNRIIKNRASERNAQIRELKKRIKELEAE